MHLAWLPPLDAARPARGAQAEKWGQFRGNWVPWTASQPSLENKKLAFRSGSRRFWQKGSDPSPSAGSCQAALISPSSGEDNACLGRVPPVTSARACQREGFCSLLLSDAFVLSPGAGAPAKPRAAASRRPRGSHPRLVPKSPPSGPRWHKGGDPTAPSHGLITKTRGYFHEKPRFCHRCLGSMVAIGLSLARGPTWCHVVGASPTLRPQPHLPILGAPPSLRTLAPSSQTQPGLTPNHPALPPSPKAPSGLFESGVATKSPPRRASRRLQPAPPHGCFPPALF